MAKISELRQKTLVLLKVLRHPILICNTLLLYIYKSD